MRQARKCQAARLIHDVEWQGLGVAGVAYTASGAQRASELTFLQAGCQIVGKREGGTRALRPPDAPHRAESQVTPARAFRRGHTWPL